MQNLCQTLVMDKAGKSSLVWQVIFAILCSNLIQKITYQKDGYYLYAGFMKRRSHLACVEGHKLNINRARAVLEKLYTIILKLLRHSDQI